MRRWVIVALFMGLMTGCSSDNDEQLVMESTEVTLTFSPYTMEAMTRTATSIASIVTHLDVWVVNGSDVIASHTTNTDDGFGTISMTLDKTKTYTLYAVGHKADGATLADGIISFTNDKVTHSMYYTTTFTPATTTSLNCLMNRIVAQFQFNTTDQKKSEVTKMRFTISDVFDRWSVTDGATHQLDRVSNFENLTTKADGTVTFNIYAIVTDAQTLHTVTVESFDSNDEPVDSRTFTDVPLRNGYKTTYTGTYFTNTATTGTFTIGDWQEYDTVNF